MPSNLEKLLGLLQELFQLDQADLDFGIYRIMNTKRDEVVRFLDKDLLPQVQEAFKQYKSADKSVLQAELDKLVVSVQNAGMNPDESPKVKELKKQIAESAVDVTALENEVFSHLFNFFRRYYSEGDFISLRRYKEGVYAIPYEGEEVKLHWANADQYYVKSSETFRDYTFKINMASRAASVPGERRVRIHLVAASTEQDNNKPAQGKERRFVLADNPLAEENGELFIKFEYRPNEGKDSQDSLNKQAIDAILKTKGFEQWAQELGRLAPTDKNKDRTVLEKHLAQYTARNTFDYFIHRDALIDYLESHYRLVGDELERVVSLATKFYESLRIFQGDFEGLKVSAEEFAAAVRAVESASVSEAEMELAVLVDEHRRLTLSWAKASDLQQEAMKGEIDRLEDSIRKTKARTVGLSVRVEQAMKADRRRQEERRRIEEELPKLEGRHRGEAFRRIFKTVTLYWKRSYHAALEKPARPRKTERPGRFSYDLEWDRIEWEFIDPADSETAL